MYLADQPDSLSDTPGIPIETAQTAPPAHAASDVARRPANPDGLPREEPGRALILIGEDHEGSRVGLRRMLESEGYAVEEAEDGAQVLEKYALCRPNLILLDAIMPRVDGFQVCATLQTLPRGSSVPVIMVTALDDRASIDRAFEAGAADYVTKPVHWPILRQRVRRLLFTQHAAEALEAERNLLRTLIDNIPDYIYIKDADCRFVINNLAHVRFMGTATPAEVVGKTDLDVFPPDLAARYYADDQQIIQSGEPQISKEEPARDHLGRERWVLATKVPLWDYSGKIVGLVGVSRDITERKAAEEALTRSNAELEHFAYIASHDLQEPLRMITGYIRLLAERYADRLGSEADEYIGYVVDGTSRMQRLIDDLLAYSRASTWGKTLKPVDCEIALLNALSNLEVTISERQADITYDPLPEILGDEVRLVSLFQNLISNALKFQRDAPPRIHVSAERQGNRWLFAVKDNGIGIEPECQEKIFEIFTRLHSRAEYPGTGIGLATCKKIVEQHSGRIWVESVVGQGSTFYFTLPVAEMQEMLQAQ